MKYLAPLCVLFFIGCQNDGNAPDNSPDLRALSTAETSVSDATGDFGFNLFRKLHTSSSDNILISPFSVSTALAMTLNGADGETRDGILNTIDYEGYTPDDLNQGYKSLSDLLTHMDRTVTINLANSAWYRQNLTLKPAFDSVITDAFDGVIDQLNFSNPSSVDVINNWVSSKTNHRITKLISHLDDSGALVLINAIYFKGSWKYRFDKSKTHAADFYLDNGQRTPVDMMVLAERPLLVMQNEDVQLVDLPYGNGQFAMTLVLPRKGKTTADIVNGLLAGGFNRWLAQADTTMIDVELPRFKMKWSKVLNDELSSLGMARAFSSDAEFPKIFLEKPLFAITEVDHAAYIEVNEEGTEAAAATSVTIGVTSAPLLEKITFDHPFLFFIRERHSGVILFIGELADPAN